MAYRKSVKSLKSVQKLRSSETRSSEFYLIFLRSANPAKRGQTDGKFFPDLRKYKICPVSSSYDKVMPVLRICPKLRVFAGHQTELQEGGDG